MKYEPIIAVLVTAALVKVISIAFGKLDRHFESVNLRFFKRILYGFVIFIGLLFALSPFVNLDKLLDTVLAGSGIAALAISLASQESLSNLISGFLIVICKPFDIGDKVFLRNSSISGFIEDITFRHTVVRTVNNSRITIPNSAMNKELIENFQLVEERSSSFMDITVEYGTDLALAKGLLAQVIQQNPLVIDVRTPEEISKEIPQVEVLVRELADSGISLRASVWTKDVSDNFKACSMIREEILKAFSQHGINLAYPSQTLYLRKDN